MYASKSQPVQHEPLEFDLTVLKCMPEADHLSECSFGVLSERLVVLGMQWGSGPARRPSWHC